MWTRRRAYLTEHEQIKNYLEKMGEFHDYLIGSFSYDSTTQVLKVTIEEDYTYDDLSNSKSLVWDLECFGVENFLMQDMEGLSKWWIYELLFDGKIFQFQLVNGYFSFEMITCKMGIPYHPSKTLDGRRLLLQFDYLLQEFKAGVNVEEMAFAFESDSQDIIRYIGYSGNEEFPYWMRKSDCYEQQSFQTAEELFNLPIYEGKSLQERWKEVLILSIVDFSLEEWLSNFSHSTDVYVDESEDDDNLYINGVALDGFIVEESFCDQCGSNQCYLEDYDDYFCPYCNRWLSKDYWYEGSYFKKRPIEPELLWKPAKLLNFAYVQYCLDGKPYTYYCSDKGICEGDHVLVPVGKMNEEKEARVSQIFKNPANNPPFPLDKIKTILQKVPAVSQEILDTASSLLGDGRVCNPSDERVVNPLLVYDILQTPIGNFWLELNGIPISMRVEMLERKFEQYPVDCALSIKPDKVHCRSFESLELCSDVDIDGARWIDILSDEYVWGNSWELNGFHLGITGQESPEFENELATRKFSRVPYYDTWHTKWQEKYGFRLAWKKYISDEDLSVDFYTTC